MAQAHETGGSGEVDAISPAWRVFQLAVFVIAMSYIIGWYIGGPTRFLDKAASGGLVQTWAGLVLFASPLMCIPVSSTCTALHRPHAPTKNRVGKAGRSRRVPSILSRCHAAQWRGRLWVVAEVGGKAWVAA